MINHAILGRKDGFCSLNYVTEHYLDLSGKNSVAMLLLHDNFTHTNIDGCLYGQVCNQTAE